MHHYDEFDRDLFKPERERREPIFWFGTPEEPWEFCDSPTAIERKLECEFDSEPRSKRDGDTGRYR